MEITVYDCRIGTGRFNVGKSWCSVCSDLVACRKNIFTVNAGNIRAGCLSSNDLIQPLAGIAADRYNRKFISIFSDMAMGAVALIYAGLLFFFDLPVWTVFVMLCVRGIGSTFQQPAIQSIIPQLVPKDQLVKTNGWMQLLNSGSFLLGPVIGASLYAVFPMSVVLMSDVVGAILASVALAVVKIPKLEKTEQEKQHFIAEKKRDCRYSEKIKNCFIS